MAPISLIIYALIFLAVITYWSVTFIILYHLNRFGIGTQPKILATVFFFGSVLLSLISILILLNIDITTLKESIDYISKIPFLGISI